MHNPEFNFSTYSDNRAPFFSTERLQLAIYLHATQRLRFWACELTDSGKVRFLFTDPANTGPQLELEFDRGAEVPATALFASQKFLRRVMSDTLNRRNEKPKYENELQEHAS